MHIASCIGNIVSRFFHKYENNEGAFHIGWLNSRDGWLTSIDRQTPRDPECRLCSRRCRRIRRPDRWRAVQPGGSFLLLPPQSKPFS